MKLSSIHHIAVIAADYEAAMAFYVEKLGLGVIRETAREEQKDRKIDLRVNDDTEIELFIKPEAPARPSYPEARGLRHLAFRVEDVEACVRELAQRGIVCEPVRTDSVTGEKMTFFRDPDGLPIEIHE